MRIHVVKIGEQESEKVERVYRVSDRLAERIGWHYTRSGCKRRKQ